MFKGTNLHEFNRFFKCEDDCRQYLYNLKWKNGYQCRRCGHDRFWPGRTRFHARCRKCNYDESVTSHTVFHKVQFSLLKAFSISFHLLIFKKGISSRNLAEVIGVNPKTALSFTQKLRKATGEWVSAKAMKSGNLKMYDVDSIIIMQRGKGRNGLQRVHLTAKQSTGLKRPQVFQCIVSAPDPASVNPCQLAAGRYVNEWKNILMWNFKSWLTGVHHHCSEKYLQSYFDEYCFKLGFRKKKKEAWHTLINWMTSPKPDDLRCNAA